ncbi:MAG: EamA family transporter [Clostridium sp.]|jgi:drug/metabolite transporter (DMT)-like permease|nr:EamA family transporter [Clostridium sp.]
MSKLGIGIGIYLFMTFIASIAQILLKKSALRNHSSIIKEYLNAYVLIAYGLIFSTMMSLVYVYKFIPLSLGPIIESTGYIFVSILGYYYLGEKMTTKKMLGIVLIVLGVIIFSLGGRS